MFPSCNSSCVLQHVSSSGTMEDDNLHRDTDKHEPMTECNVELTVFVLLVDSIVDDRRLVRSHRRDRTRDVPFCDDVQLSLYTEDTNRSHHKRYSDIEFQRDSCNCYKCKQIYLDLDYEARITSKVLRTVLVIYLIHSNR